MLENGMVLEMDRHLKDLESQNFQFAQYAALKIVRQFIFTTAN